MKILHVISSLQMGGAEKLILELAPRLKSFGHTVDIAVFDGRETPFMKHLAEYGVKIIRIREKGCPYSILNLFKLLSIVKGYEIVHSHTTPAQIFCSFCGILHPSMCLVTTEHSTYNHRRGKWYFKIMDNIVYSHYRKIICIGKKPKENLEKQIGSQGNKIEIIENGIDLAIFKDALPLDRKILCCGENDFIITMIGRFTDAKDQKTIISALTLLPDDIRLVLVGDGPLKSETEQFVKDMGACKRVIFLGVRNDVPSIIKSSDVVVLSSHWEGFGLAAVEGMAASKPVVASDVLGLREVVMEAGLLFPSGDAESLAQELLKLKENGAFYDEVAAKCFERAQKYSIEKVAKGYERLYLKLRSNNGK